MEQSAFVMKLKPGVIDATIANTLKEEACIRRWWDYNTDLMECLPDHEPCSHPLQLAFHMD